MMVVDEVFRFARAQYPVIRRPIAAVDRQIVVRTFGPDSVAHRALAGVIGILDSTFQVPAKPSEQPRAVRVTTPTDESRPDEFQPGESQPDEPPTDESQLDEQIEQAQIERVADELLEEQQTLNQAGELAAATESARERQVRLRAKHLVEEQQADQEAAAWRAGQTDS